LNPEIIVMLTHNDVTVGNAREVFRESADLPVKYWGFKDAGMTPREMEQLASDLRAAGKVPVLEVVSFDEKDLVEASELAIACGMEYFTGSSFSPKVAERVRSAGLRYFPFCGDVGGSPIELHGSAESVAQHARDIREQGADGIDLVAYRWTDGDGATLARSVADDIGRENLIIAGSINSTERLELMHQIQPFGYTMGGALFEGVFAPGQDFRANLERVLGITASLNGVPR
jgi:hypothetical protein